MSNELPKYICGSCRAMFDRPKGYQPGSSKLELILFCFGIFPGLIYRNLRGKQQVIIGCPQCKGTLIVKTASDRGRKILKKLRDEELADPPAQD